MPAEMVIGTKKVNYTWNDLTEIDVEGIGYINADTFEIVIPAQYEYAYSFTGDFALVKKTNGKKCVINKNNKVILDNFDDAVLLESEDGKTVFALTGNYSGIESYIAGEGFSRYQSFRPAKTNYRLYNLTAGKLVIKKHTQVYDNIFENILRDIKFADNYIIYENFGFEDARVYEIQSNGELKRIEIQKDEILAKIIKKRNLRSKENEFHYNGELNFDPYFFYSDTLDINLLIKNIPNNMQISEGEKGGWRFHDEKPVYYIIPIEFDPIYPFGKMNVLYEVELVSNEKDERFVGLYNALENKWAVPPMTEFSGSNFYKMPYDDWVIYVYRNWNQAVFYNINTRKKYTKMYSVDDDLTMIYVGYLSDEYKEEGEDF